jgi:predicted peroxiredoxin
VAAVEEPAELIINLTSNVNEIPESALMGLTFAEKALENNLDVTVFMNVHGVLLASNASSDIAVNDRNLHEIIQSIVEKGGNVVACPMCMEVQGVAESDLIPGIKVSGEGMMMGKLKDNPTVFTY